MCEHNSLIPVKSASLNYGVSDEERFYREELKDLIGLAFWSMPAFYVLALHGIDKIPVSKPIKLILWSVPIFVVDYVFRFVSWLGLKCIVRTTDPKIIQSSAARLEKIYDFRSTYDRSLCEQTDYFSALAMHQLQKKNKKG